MDKNRSQLNMIEKKETIYNECVIDYLDKAEEYYNIPLDIDPQYLVASNNEKKELDENINLSLQKFEEEANLKHPRIIKKNNEIIPYSVCGTKTGFLGCSRKMHQSDIHSLGFGIITYFQSLKAFILLFFIISIINIPLLFVYTQSHPEKPIINYQDFFFKTSIGNISSRLKSCQYYEINKFRTNALANKNSYINLDCGKYTLAVVDDFGVSSDRLSEINNQEQCVNFSTSMDIDISQNCSFGRYLTEEAKICIENNQSSCSIQVNSSKIIENCKNNNQFRYIFLAYTCLDNNIPIGNYKFSREKFAIVVVSIDIICVLSIIVTLLIISKSTYNNKHLYKQENLDITDYTVNFQNLKLNAQNVDIELNNLIKHIETVLIKENLIKQDELFFYDINYPLLSDDNLRIILRKNDLHEKNLNIIRKLKFGNERFTDKEIEKLENNLKKNDHKYKEYESMYNSAQLDIVQLNDVWITFNKTKFATFLNRKYINYSKLERFFLIMFCQKKRIEHL